MTARCGPRRRSRHSSPRAGPADARAPGLRFGDPRVVALFGALADFRWTAGAIRSRALRELVEAHLGAPYGPRQMAYDLRRLVRKGLLERLAHTFRYRLTELGRRLILFSAKVYNRVVCRGLAELDPAQLPRPLGTAWRHYDRELERLIAEACLAP